MNYTFLQVSLVFGNMAEETWEDRHIHNEFIVPVSITSQYEKDKVIGDITVLLKEHFKKKEHVKQ